VGYLKFFKAAHSDAAEPKKEEKVVHEMDTFLVNLADPGGKRYLKVSMKLELNNAKVAEELTEKNFQLRDTVLLLLSSKEYDEVSGYSGKMSLKQEIMGQLNRAIQSGQIKEVYFTEFLVQ
jgi:flagellar FliL protein